VRAPNAVTDLLYAGFLGLVAGLLPVYAGLVPLPLFKRMPEAWRTVLMGFSVGILLFLFADVTHEAVALSGSPGSSPILFAVGLVLGLLGPGIVSHRRTTRANAARRLEGASGGPRTSEARLVAAYSIALGIGLHNLGEGLAIGAAYGVGKLALTALLVVGFFLHNATEGLGMSAPIASVPTGLREPILLGFFAGAPTILGSMLGYLTVSDALGTVFFAVAAGALLYVVVEMVRIFYAPERMAGAFAGIVSGILLMFATGLLVPV
jgi:ZIP family zinc transporter